MACGYGDERASENLMDGELKGCAGVRWEGETLGFSTIPWGTGLATEDSRCRSLDKAAGCAINQSLTALGTGEWGVGERKYTG